MRQKRNAVASALPPIKNEHNHAGTNWPGVIIAACVVALPSLLITAWLSLVFLAAKLGSDEPERSAATFVVGVAVVASVLYGGGWLAKVILVALLREATNAIATYYDGKERVKRVETTALMTTGTAGRAMEAEQAFVWTCQLVMDEAYRQMDGGILYGQSRPWSRRQAKNIADEYGVKIKEQGTLSCDGIGPWLRRRGVINESDQVNVGKFQDISYVSALLQREFNIPVKVMSQVPTRAAAVGYEFIEDQL